jgi:hypothetical protein
MRAQHLAAIAAAHGIALPPLAVEPQAPAKVRAFALASVEVVPPPGRSKQSSQRARNAIDEPDHDFPWLAARFSFASDWSAYWPLWFELCRQAVRLGKREGWPAQVQGLLPRDAEGEPLRGASPRRQHYLEELTLLVLDQEAHPRLFRAEPRLYAWALEVEQTTWCAVLAPRYNALRAVYARWLTSARAEIGRRCRELTESEVEELSALMQEPEPVALAEAG